MSKMAEQIRKLDDGSRTSAEIARIVGCHPAYIRAVRSRGLGGANKLSESRFIERWEDRKKRRQQERLA